MHSPKDHSGGFTLVELLVAMSIAGIALTIIYAFFITQSKTYANYNQDIELQQRLRISMLLMERDLRQTAFNPGELTKAIAGNDTVDNNCNGTTDELDNALTPYVDESESIGIKIALPDSISFSMDKDGNGLACGDQEHITYALNGTTLERNGLPKMENVEVLDFVYLDKSGTVATSIESIRSVQFAIIGRVETPETSYTNTKSYVNLRGQEILATQNDGYRRRMLTSQIYFRNLND